VYSIVIKKNFENKIGLIFILKKTFSFFSTACPYFAINFLREAKATASLPIYTKAKAVEFVHFKTLPLATLPL
jgi:hypothetical protein